MLLTPPVQRTGSSSEVPMADSEMTSFGKHMLRIKEKCLFGSWCGKKGLFGCCLPGTSGAGQSPQAFDFHRLGLRLVA